MQPLLFTISVFSGLLSFATYNLGFAIEKKVVDSLDLEIRRKFLSMMFTLIKNRKWLFYLFTLWCIL